MPNQCDSGNSKSDHHDRVLSGPLSEEPTKPEITMFTTENTEVTERKEHSGRRDSSLCSVYSVVKSFTHIVSSTNHRSPGCGERH